MTVMGREQVTKAPVTRRRLAGLMGLMGAGAVGAALSPVTVTVQRQTDAAAEPASEAVSDHASGHRPVSSLAQQQANDDEMTVDEMDAMHEAGIRSFPAATQGLGGQPLDFEMDGDVKVFRLTCQVTNWEFAPGQFIDAWTYNGVTPGPEIRVTEGDTVRFEVTNELPESTAVHWHGLVVPNDQDGVPFVTQPPIKPGQTYTYQFPIRDGNAGTHMYHAHHNSAFQVTRGLLGSFIVEPRDPSTRPAFDREYTIVLNDGPIGGYSLNGKSFPATQPLVTKQGEKVLIRYMNEGLMIHPMHLHGMPMLVTAADGYLLPQPYMCDTLNIAPGQRFETIVEATELGTWAFHCHILNHAETDHGMFGMVTVLIVEP
ncbi:MAG: Multicopper oxidase [uncultured Thermomicrobiales bacterium]|uniref:Multicopper oxidase n=1 Tax=uncultured Thermomicrobiales bacterium TaxID=1645740 RepID=A0A6J4UFE4_9BACT|nr:MAG: Multicopper oxidase [uncultured Thermomicrobiales bacterium]